MQRLHAGNAIEAPIFNLVAEVNGVKYGTHHFQNKAPTNITPHRCFVLDVIRPDKGILSVDDVRDEEPRDQGENRDRPAWPMPAAGDQNEEPGDECAGR